MTLTLNGTLILVGAGNMGGALLKGLLDGGLNSAQVIALDPMPPDSMRNMLSERGVACLASPPKLAEPAEVILLAVKPQILDDVAPGLASLAGAGTVVLSVAAGRTIASIARHFASDTAIVRSIPNTPASIGRGITAAIGNRYVSPAQRALCRSLLAAVGEVVWLDDEKLIDAATAVSGSGPAYVFLLAECLAEAGRKAGLPTEIAMRLARATVAGAGELIHRSELDAATLRQNVTSPNGTTAAALEVLMGKDELQQLMIRAVAAADARARQLAS